MSRTMARAPSAPLRRSALAKAVLLFAALGDETRLRLVALLCVGGARSIRELTSGTEITRQAVTKHLQVLAEAGLVRDRKTGRERLWTFDVARLDAARESLDRF